MQAVANAASGVKNFCLDAITYPGQRWIVFETYNSDVALITRVALGVIGFVGIAKLAAVLVVPWAQMQCIVVHGLIAFGISVSVIAAAVAAVLLPTFFAGLAYLFPRPDEPVEVTAGRRWAPWPFRLELGPLFIRYSRSGGLQLGRGDHVQMRIGAMRVYGVRQWNSSKPDTTFGSWNQRLEAGGYLQSNEKSLDVEFMFKIAKVYLLYFLHLRTNSFNMNDTQKFPATGPAYYDTVEEAMEKGPQLDAWMQWMHQFDETTDSMENPYMEMLTLRFCLGEEVEETVREWIDELDDAGKQAMQGLWREMSALSEKFLRSEAFRKGIQTIVN